MASDLLRSDVRRVVLVVLDGLRPDALNSFGLKHLTALSRRSATTLHGRTVSPSVTACAMASLLTGASPERHGLQGERFTIPRSRGPIRPLPKVLAEHGIPTWAFLTRVPFFMGGIAQRIACYAGMADARFTGTGAHDVLDAAAGTIERMRRGMVVMHWPDADRAGHARGWMSPEYRTAALAMDNAIGRLTTMVDLDDPSTLLIAMADHGGGGARPRHHNSLHPLDLTIPIFIAGGSVRAGDLGHDISLTDVPATVLWSMGIRQPESYAGRALVQAFYAMQVAA